MSDSDLLHGEPLAGKYEVAASISRGSRFNILLAYHTRFGWPVALKILKTEYALVDDLADQVHAQLEIVSKQAHPNLVPIYEVGLTAADQPFAAMAYLEGNTLAHWTEELEQQPDAIPARELLLLTRRIALGAATLHRAGVIHPGLNPSNILINQDSTPVIVGLGMPAVLPDHVPQVSEIEIVQYRAPEVKLGATPDVRSDVYSLGIMLYELLSLNSTADRRWPGGTAPPMPLERVREDLSAETAFVVNTCLNKEPDERFQSMEDVVARLDMALAAESDGSVNRLKGIWQTSSVSARFDQHRRVILAGVATLFLAIFVLAFMLTRPTGNDLNDTPGQGASPFPARTTPVDLARPNQSNNPVELLEPPENAIYQPGDELLFRWCWSEQPLEQEQFAVYVAIEDRELRLPQPVERTDVFCYKTLVQYDEFAGQPGDYTWRIKLIDEATGIVVVTSDWLSLTVAAPILPPTATPSPTPSPTLAPTSTPTATPTTTPTASRTPTMTPTETATPPPATATTPPPTATETPVPTSPPPTAAPPTNPPPTARPTNPPPTAPPTATPPPPIATATPP